MNPTWSNPPVSGPTWVGPVASAPPRRTRRELLALGVEALTRQMENTTQSYEAMVGAVLAALDEAGALAYREES